MSDGFDPRQLGEEQGVDPRSLVTTAEVGGFDPRSLSNAGGVNPRRLSPNVTPEQSWPDVTVGSTEYGAADTASIMARSINHHLSSPANSLEDFSNSMEDFKKSHPEYGPTEVQNTLDLISNPKAISSRVFGSAAYTGMMMGTSMIPAAGWAVTGLTAYGIESQRAYEQALHEGATVQEAETAGRATGTANAIGQMIMSSKMLSILKGEGANFTRQLNNSTNSIQNAIGKGAFGMVKDAGVLGAINAIQGGIDDKIATDVYGAENRDPFNWDRRLQEGSIGAISSMLIGAPMGVVKIRKAIMDGEGNPTGQTADLNVFDRDTAFRYFKSKGAPTERARDMAAMTDLWASQHASDTGMPKESFFPSVINDKNFELGSNGAALQAKTQSVFDSFEKDPATTLKTLMKTAVSQFPADKVNALKDSLGITDKMSPGEADAKMDSAMLRYLWDTQPVSPEMAEPLEGIKQMLVDTYKNVTTLGAKKLPVESKIILDSMLAPETDAITSTRDRLAAARADLKSNFPPEFNPANLLTNEELQSLIEPIREEKVTHEFDPQFLNVSKETKETILRRPTTEEMKAKMEELIASKTPTEQAGNAPSEVKPELGLVEGVPRSRQEANLLIVDLYNELDRLRMGRLIRDEMSGVERRSESGQWLRDHLIRESPGDASSRQDFMQRAMRKLIPDEVASWFDKQSPLRKTESGVTLLDLGSEKEALSKAMDGPYNYEGGKKAASLGWKERLWLQKRDAMGFTNLEKIVDQSLPPEFRVTIPEKFRNVKDFVDFHAQMNREYGATAKAQGQTMRFADGKNRPYQQPDANRFLRLHTNEFREMAANPDGRQWKSFLENIKNLPGNEDLAKMKTSDISQKAQEVFHDTEIRSNSALESARLFKVVPSEVPIEVNRKMMTKEQYDAAIKRGVTGLKKEGNEYFKPIYRNKQLFETDPIRYIARASKVQADRLAWGKLAGQSTLSKVENSAIARVAKILDVTPANDAAALIRRIRSELLGTPLERLQTNLEKTTISKGQHGPPNSAEAVVANLKDHLDAAERERGSLDVPDPLSDKKALAQAVSLARSLKINLRPSRQDYLDNINSITATNMTEKQARSLKSAARQLEGINIELPKHELLSEVKSRLSEDTFSVIDNLMKRIDKETGVTNNPHALRVLKDIQGIPSAGGPEIPSIIKSVTSMIGTTMTAFRAPLHVPQTAWQILPDVGIKAYSEAMQSVLNEKTSVRERLNILGSVPHTVNRIGFEKILSMENLGKLAHLSEYPKILAGVAKAYRQVVNKTMLIDYVMNQNNLIAGESYRNYAKGLMDRPIVNGKANVTSSDVATLKKVGLSSQEIEGVKTGQISETTFAKIVLGGVQRLGTDLPAFKQGRIETSPIGRMTFAFSGYAINSGRILSGFMRHNVYEAMKSKDVPSMIRAGRDILTFVGAALGAGALTEVLYSIPRGSEMRQRLKEDDETTLHRATGALIKIAFVGPAARVMEGVSANGASDIILGSMPYLHAVGKLISMFSSNVNELIYGKPDVEQKFGRYGFGREVSEYLKSMNPMVREWGHTLDNAQYPDKPGYDEARQTVAMYKAKSSKTTGVPKPEALDPMKNDVYFYVQRGDRKGAVTAAQDYYRDYFEQIKGDPRNAIIHGMSPLQATESLRTSLNNRAPLDLTEMEKLDFLSSLPPDRAKKYLRMDIKYRALVDGIAPKER